MEYEMRYSRHAQRRAALGGGRGNRDATGGHWIGSGDSDSADGGWEERLSDPHGGDAEQGEAVGAAFADAAASAAVASAAAATAPQSEATRSRAKPRGRSLRTLTLPRQR